MQLAILRHIAPESAAEFPEIEELGFGDILDDLELMDAADVSERQKMPQSVREGQAFFSLLRGDI